MSFTATLSMTVSHDDYFALRALKEATSSDLGSPLRFELVHPVSTRGFEVDVVLRVVLADGQGSDARGAVLRVLADRPAAWEA